MRYDTTPYSALFCDTGVSGIAGGVGATLNPVPRCDEHDILLRIANGYSGVVPPAYYSMRLPCYYRTFSSHETLRTWLNNHLPHPTHTTHTHTTYCGTLTIADYPTYTHGFRPFAGKLTLRTWNS